MTFQIRKKNRWITVVSKITHLPSAILLKTPSQQVSILNSENKK